MMKTRDKVTDAASNVKPYVERALRDEELRENLKSAFDSARHLYDELLGGRGVTAVATRVATDKEIQDSLRRAVDELRHAADRLQGKDRHAGRNSMLLLTGVALAILFNPVTGPDTRRWIKEKVLGESGDSFGYERAGTDGSPS